MAQTDTRRRVRGMAPKRNTEALLHEELSEVKRRRTELKAELRAASKEDRKLRKRRANLVKAAKNLSREDIEKLLENQGGPAEPAAGGAAGG